jgi:hypothetical protein
MVFDSMYFDICCDAMKSPASTTYLRTSDVLFTMYVIITPDDLSHNLEAMRNAWDHQKPVENSFKQI